MSWRNLIWMSLILCLAGLALVLARGQPARVEPHDPAIDELAGALAAHNEIQRRAYRPNSGWDATCGAIDGMVRKLDPYSMYVPPGFDAPFRDQVEGIAQETGLELTEDSGRLLVLGAVPGSPAEKLGLSAGTELVAIDETPAADLTLEAARKLVQRPEKSPVRLRLRGPGGAAQERLLERARIELPTVTGLLRDEAGRWVHKIDPSGICYVRVTEFVRRTPREFQQALADMKAPQSPESLVLDLRGNPGGMLPAVVEIADMFLTEGLIVRTLHRDGREEPHFARPGAELPPLPTVVLVDGQTASGGEILAGALQRHGRAVLLGQPTYGKWCVQSFVPLSHGLGNVYMTTARYVLPEPAAQGALLRTTQPATQTQPGRVATRPAETTLPVPCAATAPADRQGLVPDVLMKLTPKGAEKLAQLRLAAAVPPLPASPPAPPGRAAARVQASRQLLLKTDTQLERAVQLLRDRRVLTSRPAAVAGAAGVIQPGE